MDITKDDYIRYTKKFMERLCSGDPKMWEKYGTKMLWSLPRHNGFLRRGHEKWEEAFCHLADGVKDVIHKDYSAALLEGGTVMVSGIFYTHIKKPGSLYQSHCYYVHVVFISGKIVCLEIEPKESIGKRLELHNLERESRFVWEDEIVYIEVIHDHLYWNCRLDVLETTGTLRKLEGSLSDFFVRIHRSYMVNRYHVSRIGKYEVSMDNGHVLQIPQKKYLEVKNKLQGSSPEQ